MRVRWSLFGPGFDSRRLHYVRADLPPSPRLLIAAAGIDCAIPAGADSRRLRYVRADLPPSPRLLIAAAGIDCAIPAGVDSRRLHYGLKPLRGPCAFGAGTG